MCYTKKVRLRVRGHFENLRVYLLIQQLTSMPSWFTAAVPNHEVISGKHKSTVWHPSVCLDLEISDDHVSIWSFPIHVGELLIGPLSNGGWV